MDVLSLLVEQVVVAGEIRIAGRKIQRRQTLRHSVYQGVTDTRLSSSPDSLQISANISLASNNYCRVWFQIDPLWHLQPQPPG